VAFDSLQYLLFLGAVLAVSLRIAKKPGELLPGFLLFASLAFYAFAGWLPFALFVASILVNQRLMESIAADADASSRRRLLALGVVYNLLYLFAFKYAAFMQGAWGSLGAWLGWWQPPAALVEVVLPVGISFYTFESLSILTDVYKGRYPAPRLREHALFVSFFPHLVAGPILRGSELLPQLAALSGPRPPVAWGRALAFLSLGLFKKAVLADTLALYADPVFNEPWAFAAPRAWLAATAFAFQIYYDFSGYSDMAEGSAALLGLRLKPNFRQPYAAVSLTDFWRRWHVSLSSWLRDYLYIPLGGSRHGAARTYAALFTTMLLGGLWHGANFTFVAWGCFHGLGLAFERASGLGALEADGWRRPLRQAATFGVVLLGWVLFRSASLADAGRFMQQAWQGAWAFDSTDAFVVAWLGLAWLFSKWEARWEEGAWNGGVDHLGPVALAGLQVTALACKLALSGLGRPFIYFRF
jgi:D-alanyl-lipoteichoic acid acyltransferase DltB (MBOAT superfamily)